MYVYMYIYIYIYINKALCVAGEFALSPATD